MKTIVTITTCDFPACDNEAAKAHTISGKRGGATVDLCPDHAQKLAWMVAPLQEPRRNGLPDGDHRHGTRGGYQYHRCRCDMCRAAVAQKQRELVRRRRAATA